MKYVVISQIFTVLGKLIALYLLIASTILLVSVGECVYRDKTTCRTKIDALGIDINIEREEQENG